MDNAKALKKINKAKKHFSKAAQHMARVNMSVDHRKRYGVLAAKVDKMLDAVGRAINGDASQ